VLVLVLVFSFSLFLVEKLGKDLSLVRGSCFFVEDIFVAAGGVLDALLLAPEGE